MSQTYTPTGTVAIMPQSAPPGLGVDVALSIPENSDGFNADNYHQALRQLGQWTQWFSDHVLVKDVSGQIITVPIEVLASLAVRRLHMAGTALSSGIVTATYCGTSPTVALDGTDHYWRLRITLGAGATAPAWSFAFADGNFNAGAAWDITMEALSSTVVSRFIRAGEFAESALGSGGNTWTHRVTMSASGVVGTHISTGHTFQAGDVLVVYGSYR